jgi:hypothetical protein
MMQMYKCIDVAHLNGHVALSTQLDFLFIFY